MELALVIDNSGSTVGFVDRVNLHEDQPGKFESPTPLVPSDPHSARTWAASRLLEQLNAGDRVIGYWYDEDSGIRVAASDNRSCEGGERDGLRCSKDAHCAGGWCQIGGAPGGNTLSSKTIPQWEKTAFGGGAEHRWLLDTDLQGSQKYAAEGRAPMWPAVGKAYDFLLGAAERNRQILVFADGPDTCNPSEDFDFTGSDGTCRLPCAVGGPDFETLRTKMHQAGWPVRLHFVQFQAPAYREPDAAMMEMACRSGGTYQFINSQEIALSGGDFSKALSRATARRPNRWSRAAAPWPCPGAWLSTRRDLRAPNTALHRRPWPTSLRPPKPKMAAWSSAPLAPATAIAVARTPAAPTTAHPRASASPRRHRIGCRARARRARPRPTCAAAASARPTAWRPARRDIVPATEERSTIFQVVTVHTYDI